MATWVAGYSPNDLQPGPGAPSRSEHALGSVLADVATTADDLADDQRRVARRARAMVRERASGASWAEVLDREGEPRLLDLLRTNARRLAEVTGRLAQTIARGLADEGESRRQIARRLQVTHQRISAMLANDRHAGNSDRRSSR